jgi:hypothetical protein
MSRLSDQTVELMGAYIEGELDAEAAASFEAQMEADPALFAEVESMRETVRRLASLERPTAPEGFSADLAARLRSRSVTERRGGMGLEERWLQLLMVAAVAMLAWLLWPHGGPVRPSAGSTDGSGSGSGVEEIVVPALPAGEVEIEPALPSRVAGGPVMAMKAVEKDLMDMKVTELKEELASRDEPVSGNKAWLRRRLHAAIVREHLEAASEE